MGAPISGGGLIKGERIVLLYQSNTNYSCNAILWDRLFGTYCDEPVEQTGIGPIEPTLVEELLLPIKEPDYTTTAP